ncbi:uncharacterized protein LOC127282298 [Leptopilina boulardi]|uniref:uncharacterized protein LOC127282298 n=1 Tax=Leptopilina boulardi TaxID=63433 RepID=UPI0021F63867|nr:uncharacterized protein LOC127282298 [Leptopilina boulardi]
MPEGFYLPGSVTQKRLNSQKPVQPYMILVKGQCKDRFFLQKDGWYIEMNAKVGPLVVLDLLFKLHYAFNVCYADSLLLFYNFMNVFLYKTSTAARNSVSSLNISLKSLNLDSSTDDEDEFMD